MSGRQADDALAAITKEYNAVDDYSKDHPEKHLAALAKQQTKIITLCEAFIAEFPHHAKLAAVKLDLAGALLMRVSWDQSPSRVKDLATIGKLGGEVLASNGNKELKPSAHSLLIAVEFFSEQPDLSKAERHAAALLKDYPKDKETPSAQLMFAMLAERAGDIERARAAYKVLVDKYANTEDAQQAEERLRRLEMVGKKLKDFRYTDVTGKKIDLADYKGKVVLIDFWATWCGPCRAELPNVRETFKKYGNEGFAILGVSLDEDKHALLDFMKQENMTWPQYFDGKGWKNRLARQYQINSIPTTFLVDRNGIIRYVDLQGGALGAKVAELLGVKQAEAQSLPTQTLEGVTVKLHGARYDAKNKVLYIRAEVWGRDKDKDALEVYHFGTPTVLLDGERREKALQTYVLHDYHRISCNSVPKEWPMQAGEGNSVITCFVSGLTAMPKKVGIELPLRKNYEGTPYIWKRVEVGKTERSFSSIKSDDHELTLQRVWWQEAGRVQMSKGRWSTSFSINQPAVCLQLSVKQINKTSNQKVDDQINAWTVEGDPLQKERSVIPPPEEGQEEHILVVFCSPKAQPIRVTWCPIYARETGKKFEFTNIKAKPL